MIQQIFYGTNEYEMSFQLVDEVLRKPWGKSLAGDDLSTEQEGIDTKWGYFHEGTLVCSATLAPVSEDIVKIRYFATKEEARGKGYGKAVLLAMEEFARKENYKKIILDARVAAQQFYQKLGYQTQGQEYIHEQIQVPHIKMYKVL